MKIVVKLPEVKCEASLVGQFLAKAPFFFCLLCGSVQTYCVNRLYLFIFEDIGIHVVLDKKGLVHLQSAVIPHKLASRNARLQDVSF